VTAAGDLPPGVGADRVLRIADGLVVEDSAT
jgi:hypothetical protein